MVTVDITDCGEIVGRSVKENCGESGLHRFDENLCHLTRLFKNVNC